MTIGLSARRAIDEAKKLQRHRLDGVRDDAGNNVARMYAEMMDAHATGEATGKGSRCVSDARQWRC